MINKSMSNELEEVVVSSILRVKVEVRKPSNMSGAIRRDIIGVPANLQHSIIPNRLLAGYSESLILHKYLSVEVEAQLLLVQWQQRELKSQRLWTSRDQPLTSLSSKAVSFRDLSYSSFGESDQSLIAKSRLCERYSIMAR